MKKHLMIISLVVIVISIFVSCSASSSNEEISTTAVTDKQGTTHYYEPVTDEKNKSVYAEIVNDDKGKAVTNKNGTYVTKEHTTILPIENKSDNTSSTIQPTAEKFSSTTNSNADNDIEFEIPDKETTKQTTTEKQITTTTTETTTSKETQPATDKDGWITKWY